ncbi:hypothetical protein [Leptolyngbya ohadii]|uniref:hypothetical protein n=1 Tax=Leptolyngbya ohadii TaxID=1962290 RepID=UPI000B59E1CB|nr:hypothetical protein [Leptolyngbya ohadii]
MPNPSLYRVSSSSLARQKLIGTYLTEAGLLTSDQIQVILNDQHATGMRFGDIAVARGWVKEQTIEWIMSKVVEPERRAIQTVIARQAAELSQKTEPMLPKEPPPQSRQSSKKKLETASQSTKPFVRRDAPIAKPLPPINSSDSEVNWVG